MSSFLSKNMDGNTTPFSLGCLGTMFSKTGSFSRKIDVASLIHT
ncbi:MAG: hypothetical protein ACJAWV_003814 [Flammeovirgaceae bacterium]|jgi:hypothetical protein